MGYAAMAMPGDEKACADFAGASYMAMDFLQLLMHLRGLYM